MRFISLVNLHTDFIMSIRKSLAKQFINAAKALENDTSKEKVKAMITVGRIKLANAIMPNIPPIKS